MARQIVVSGGAGYWCGPEGSKLDEYALSLTGVSRPRVCALCTASGDSDSYVQGFYDQFQDQCEVSHLPLFMPPFEDPADLLARQDLIYVGGGSTANLLAVWRLHGIDGLLADALDRGTILYGSGAGGICWFESGLTDSLSFDGSLRPLTNALGLLTGSHAPHFDRPDRADLYATIIAAGQLADGIGIDDFAAVHYIDGEIHQVVATRPDATAHLVASDGRTGAFRPDRQGDRSGEDSGDAGVDAGGTGQVPPLDRGQPQRGVVPHDRDERELASEVGADDPEDDFDPHAAAGR